MSTEKLPEWPEDLRPGSVSGHDEFVWLDESLTAALARMEALAKELRDLRSLIDGDVRRFQDLYRIDELLVACERGKEAGR